MRVNRVAIVTESFLPNINGVTNSVLRVVEHLQATGREAIIIAPDLPTGLRSADASAAVEHLGYPVVRVPSMMVPKISSLPVGLPPRGIVAALQDFEPDVVHLASPFLLGAGGLGAARRLGLPTVAVYQTDVAGFAASYGLGLSARAAWWWTRKIHSLAGRTLAPSSAAVNDLVTHGIPRVHTWGRGVDIDRFSPRHRSDDLRASWLATARPAARRHPTAADQRLVVGLVGRLAPEKHVERLACLARRDDVQLVIVGDGPQRASLQRAMPTAVFTGELTGPDLSAAYASLDVFVHCGEHETFCQAVQESLASGVPTIGPDQGGPRDLISHCRNGYLLPVAEFGKRLPATIDTLKDPALRQRYGDNARRSVLGRTWPALCEQLIGHYEAVAHAGPIEPSYRRSA